MTEQADAKPNEFYYMTEFMFEPLLKGGTQQLLQARLMLLRESSWVVQDAFSYNDRYGVAEHRIAKAVHDARISGAEDIAVVVDMKRKVEPEGAARDYVLYDVATQRLHVWRNEYARVLRIGDTVRAKLPTSTTAADADDGFVYRHPYHMTDHDVGTYMERFFELCIPGRIPVERRKLSLLYPYLTHYARPDGDIRCSFGATSGEPIFSFDIPASVLRRFNMTAQGMCEAALHYVGSLATSKDLKTHVFDTSAMVSYAEQPVRVIDTYIFPTIGACLCNNNVTT